MPSRVELSVSGIAYGGFIGGEVNLSMEQAANTFTFRYADKWTPEGATWPIYRGAECAIRINDGKPNGKKVLALTGYVDETTIRYTDRTLELEAAGRSKTADLVDCSAHHKPGQWKKQKIDKICTDLCKPFGITSHIRVGLLGDKFDKFAIDTGETVIEAITRAAKLRGLFPYCDPYGNLNLSQVGKERVPITLSSGKNGNILAATRTESWQDRFSDYFFRGQKQGSDNAWAKTVAHINGDVQDDVLAKQYERYRPLKIISQGQGGAKDLKIRATWERNRRAGKSERLNITVSDYFYAPGKLWEPNKIVRVKDEKLHIAGDDYIIVSVRFRFGPEGSDGGYITELELTQPEAFSQEPLRKKKGKKGKPGFKPPDQ